MYKKQMKMQRIACFLSIAASALVFLYALGIMTDLYDMLYTMIPVPDDPSSVKVAGAMIYYDMQGFNQSLLRASIGLILVSCLLFITNTHIRRRYYIGNYISIAAFVVANFYVAIESHGYIEAYKERFLRVDFEALRKHADLWKTAYTDSTFWFDAHYAVFALSLLVCVGLVICTLWKIRLMKEEKALIAQGKEATA